MLESVPNRETNVTDEPKTMGLAIAASTKLGMSYADRLLSGVAADQFARFASPGGVAIDSNHPCFILGHLSLYAPRVVEELGGDVSGIAPNEEFVKLFGKGSKCVDDPDGSVYPSMEQVVVVFRAAHQRAIEVLERTSDELFRAANPNEAMRDKFSTVGAMHNFYLGGHLMMHMGQFSAWRRAMGMGPA